jgi:hypothetical protein
MSDITPYSSFTSSPLANNFPALKMLFHADDYSPGSLTWVCRKTGVVANLATVCTKDSEGVYAITSTSVSSVTGSMPAISKYAVAIACGKPTAASATAGITASFGDGGSLGAAVQAAGLVYDITLSQLNSAPALSTAPSTVGKPSCQMARFDLISTGALATRVSRVLANNTDNVIGNGSADITTPGIIVLGGGGVISAGLSIGGISGSNDGRRTKFIALFDFTVNPSAADLQIAASEMARTQQLFAGWRNRV